MIYRDILGDIHLKIYKSLPQDINRILDIGCRQGEFTKFLINKSRFTVGLDFQMAFLKGRDKNDKKELVFVNSYAEKLPFKNKSFDYVILAEVLEHSSSEEECISEAYRVLNDNGKLIITVPHKGVFCFLDPDNFKFYLPFVYNKLYALFNKRKPLKSLSFSGKSEYHNHYSLQEIRKLLSKRFEILQIHRGGLFFPVYIWIKYLIEHFRVHNSYILQMLRHLSNCDYNLNCGKFGYTLFLVASKNKLRDINYA